MEIAWTADEAIEMILKMAELNTKSGTLMHAEAMGMLRALALPRPNETFSVDKDVQHHYNHGFRKAQDILQRAVRPLTTTERKINHDE